MNIDFLASTSSTLLATATLICLLGLALGMALKRTSAAVRHFYWSILVAGLLLLPALTLVSPKLTFNLPTQTRTVESSEEAPIDLAASQYQVRSGNEIEGQTAAPTSSAVETSLVNTATEVPAVAMTPKSNPLNDRSVLKTLLSLWFLGSAIVGCWFIAGWIRLHRLVKSSSENPIPNQTVALCRQAAETIRLTRSYRIIQSHATSMPMVVGAMNAVLVLPSSFSQWDPKRQHAVLLHELGHIQRFDCLAHLASQLCCALYWFHPLVWWIKSNQLAAAESACDDIAIRAGSEQSAYAEHLLKIAESLKGRAILTGPAAPMAGYSKLETRLRQILARSANRSRLSRAFAISCIAIVGIMTLTLSSLRLTAQADDVNQSEPLNTENPLSETIADPIDLELAQANSLREDSAFEVGLVENDPAPKENVVLGGVLESSVMIEISSQLDKPATIQWRAKSGQKVEKGDVIVEFEQEAVSRELETREIELAKERATVDAINNRLQQSIREGEETVRAQTLKLERVHLRQRQWEAEFKVRVKKASSQVELSSQRLAEAEKRFATTKLKVEKGIGDSNQIDSIKLEIAEEQVALEIAMDELSALENQTKDYEKIEHELALQEAQSTLRRAKSEMNNHITSAEAELASARTILDIKVRGFDRLAKQKTFSTVRAPISGQVLHRRKNGAPLLRTTVRKGQSVLYLIDPSQLEIKLMVSESQRKQLKLDQQVAVRVDALPGREFRGEIKHIGDETDALQRDPLHEPEVGYPIMVRLVPTDDNASVMLRPGLTAQVALPTAAENR